MHYLPRTSTAMKWPDCLGVQGVCKAPCVGLRQGVPKRLPVCSSVPSKGYSYTKNKYFTPSCDPHSASTDRDKSLACHPTRRYTELSTSIGKMFAERSGYTEPEGTTRTFMERCGRRRGYTENVPGYRDVSIHGNRGKDSVTGRIEDLLHHYGAGTNRCEQRVCKIRPGPRRSESGRGKAVHFARNVEHIGKIRETSGRRSAEAMSWMERYDRLNPNNLSKDSGSTLSGEDKPNRLEFSRTLPIPSKYSRNYPSKERDPTVGSYTNIGLLKSVLKSVHDERGIEETTERFRAKNTVQAKGRENTIQIEGRENAAQANGREKPVQSKRSENAVQAEVRENTVHTTERQNTVDGEREKTYKDTSVQCTDEMVNGKMAIEEKQVKIVEKIEDLDQKDSERSEKIRLLFEKLDSPRRKPCLPSLEQHPIRPRLKPCLPLLEQTSPDCTFSVCKNTLIRTDTVLQERQSLTTIVTSAPVWSERTAATCGGKKSSKIPRQNAVRDACGGGGISRQVFPSKKSLARPRKLVCDPQCQKLKKKIADIHSGRFDQEPFYSFCGKANARGMLSHPVLDRKRPAKGKSRKFHAEKSRHKVAIIKTVDETKISIKANNLVINCTKENCASLLDKIEMIKL